MKLWLLKCKALHGVKDNPWSPWYDTAQGFVIRAETTEQARTLALSHGGYEVDKYPDAWTNPKYSSCEELIAEGKEALILRDFSAA